MNLRVIRLMVYGAVSLTCLGAMWFLSMKLPSALDNIDGAADDALPTLSSDQLVEQLDDINLFDSRVADLDQSEPIKPVLRGEQNFADAQTFRSNKDKWAIEVMDVSDQQIIKDYLFLNQNNENLRYFRYKTPDQQIRFKLLWGLFDTQASAAGFTADSPYLGLSRPYQLVSIDQVLLSIDDYYVMSRVRDYSRSKVRGVSLTQIRYVPDPVSSTNSTASSDLLLDDELAPASEEEGFLTQPTASQEVDTALEPVQKQDDLFDLIQDIDE